MSQDCIFCKIIDGEIPASKIYEDEHVLAFLDISQVTKGHTLVIPKQHTRNIFDTPGEVTAQMFSQVPLIANAIKKAFNPVGMNILNNNEAPADQSVFHLHFHLIPRYGNNEDGYSTNWQPNPDKYSAEDLTNISAEIKKQL